MKKPTAHKRSFIYMALILLLSACAPATEVAPVVVETSTPETTSTPAFTSTPKASFTPVPTETITPTLTPNVTATLLPAIPPASEGKGNVAGLVLWNNQPVPKAAVWLCEKFEGDCLGVYQYRTNTDSSGYYVFENVKPGKYIVAINSFSTGWFMFYSDSNGNREQEVSAGQDLILNPWSIWKTNLHATTPSIDKVLADPMPTLKWDAYPDAAYYQIYIYDINWNAVLEDQRVNGTEFTLTQPLVTCRFYWDVLAFNSQGSLIASTRPGYMYFYIIDVPGTC